MDIDPKSTEVPRSAKGRNYVNQVVGVKHYPRRLVLGDFLDSTFMTSDSDPESDYRDHHAGSMVGGGPVGEGLKLRKKHPDKLEKTELCPVSGCEVFFQSEDNMNMQNH